MNTLTFNSPWSRASGWARGLTIATLIGLRFLRRFLCKRTSGPGRCEDK